MKIWSELRRRNVLRMAALYVVTAWLLMQVADVLIDLGRLPEAYGPLVLQVLGIGLPIALVLSWFFEGTRPDAEVDQAARQKRARRTDFAIIGVLSLALAAFAWINIYGPKIEGSIAVLPFENLTGDTNDSYLPDGITEEIRHRLTTFGNLTVIDRYSVDKVKGLALEVIASKLNVEHVLQGSVRRSGDRVRILASLVNVETTKTTWSDSYDRDLTVAGLFEVQVDIARAIAEKLQAIISPEAAAQMANAPTQDLEAYRLFLLGIRSIHGKNTEERERARGYFERAIEIDPEFAEAYAYLALAGRCEEDCQREAIDKALALDDTVGIAHAGMARLIEDEQRAREEFELALSLGPADAQVWELYGDYLHRDVGDYQAALDAYERAIALQPLKFRIYRFAGISAFMLNRPDKAVAFFERAIAIEPDYARAYSWYAVEIWNFNHEGYDKAIALLHKASGLDPKDRHPLFMLGWLCVDLGEIRGAEALFRAIGSDPGLAEIHHLRGEHAPELQLLEALQWVRRLAPHYIDDGRFEEALDLIRWKYPQLVESLEVDTKLAAHINAMDGFQLAKTLEGLGRVDEATKLWDQIEGLVEGSPSQFVGGTRVFPAVMYARLGRKEKALRHLREVVDSGWRAGWRRVLSQSEFDSVRDDPRFRQTVYEIEADMAEQLARVHAQGLACEVPAGFQPDPD